MEPNPYEADYYKERVDELSVTNELLRTELEQARTHITRLEVALDNKNAELGRLTLLASHQYFR
jgi:ParB-like chromosome segregation protein Spo0J